MAKSQFTNGSYVTSDYIESIYGSGPTGGHQHDGVDADGHVRQVNASTDITGMLPVSSVPNIPWSNIGGITNNNTMADISSGLTATITKADLTANGYVSITRARAVKFNLNTHLEMQLAISSVADATQVKITIIGMTPTWQPAAHYLGDLFVWTNIASYQQVFAGRVCPMWATWTASKNIYIQHNSDFPIALNGGAAVISCIMDYEALQS